MLVGANEGQNHAKDLLGEGGGMMMMMMYVHRRVEVGIGHAGEV